MSLFKHYFKKNTDKEKTEHISVHRTAQILLKASNDSREYFKHLTKSLIAACIAEEDPIKKAPLQLKTDAARYMWLEKSSMELVDCKAGFYGFIDAALMARSKEIASKMPQSVLDFRKRIMQNKENPYQMIMDGKDIEDKATKLLWLNNCSSHNPVSTFCGLSLIRNTDKSTILYSVVTNYLQNPSAEHTNIIRSILTIDLSLQHQRRDCARIKSNLEPFINMRVEGNKTVYDLVIESENSYLCRLFARHAQSRTHLAQEKPNYKIEPMKCSKSNIKKALTHAPAVHRRTITAEELGIQIARDPSILYMDVVPAPAAETFQTLVLPNITSPTSSLRVSHSNNIKAESDGMSHLAKLASRRTGLLNHTAKIGLFPELLQQSSTGRI